MPIEFEENEQFNEKFDQTLEKQTPKMAAWLIKIGAAKNEKDATIIMIVTIVVCFALTLFFIFK